jgi:putative transposase
MATYPQKQVLVHSEQWSQYTSYKWQTFLKSHGLEGSIGTREKARSDIFDYIEMFYSSKRRHGSSDQMPPTEYEKQYYQRLRSVQIIRGDPLRIAAIYEYHSYPVSG